MTIGHTFFYCLHHDMIKDFSVCWYIHTMQTLSRCKKKKKVILINISDHRRENLTQITAKGGSKIVWHDTEVRLLPSSDEGASLLKFIIQNCLLRPHVVVVPYDRPLEIGADYVDGFRLNWRLRRSCEWRRRRRKGTRSRRHGLCFPLLSLAAAAPDPICNAGTKSEMFIF